MKDNREKENKKLEPVKLKMLKRCLTKLIQYQIISLIMMHIQTHFQWFCAGTAQTQAVSLSYKNKSWHICLMRVWWVGWLTLLAEGPADRLGLQEREEPWECIGPHVPHGHDVSDHHWPHNGQGQVLRSHSSHADLEGTFWDWKK